MHNAKVQNTALETVPDKFKFGDRVRCRGNTAYTKVSNMGVVIGHSSIVCPMSRVMFDNGKIGYIADSELDKI